MNKNNDPWELLREARGRIGSCECGDEACEPTAVFARRIDAALAEAQGKPPCSCGQPYPCMKGCPDCCHSQGYLDYCQGDRHAERQDSAKDVVEYATGKGDIENVTWEEMSKDFFVANPDDYTTMDAMLVPSTGNWLWSVAIEKEASGRTSTLAEAKAAAIAAARGMK